MREPIEKLLLQQGCRVEACSTIERVWAAFAPGRFDSVLSDVIMPDGRDTDLVEQIHEQQPQLQVCWLPAIPTSGSTWTICGGWKYRFCKNRLLLLIYWVKCVCCWSGLR